MAHFAQLDKNNIVTTVIVVSNDDAPGDLPESETAGQTFIALLGLEGTWKQTSYNATFRRKYATIGDTYDETLDGFMPPSPGDDYTFNTDTWEWEQ